MTAIEFVVGNMYRVRYGYIAGNGRPIQRVMQAVYLGTGSSDGVLAFSYRPLAGTTIILRADIVAAREVPPREGPMLPRRAAPVLSDGSGVLEVKR